jgi:hypothetical protein
VYELLDEGVVGREYVELLEGRLTLRDTPIPEDELAREPPKAASDETWKVSSDRASIGTINFFILYLLIYLMGRG